MVPRYKTVVLLLTVLLIAGAGIGGYLYFAPVRTPASSVAVVNLTATSVACRESRAACLARHPDLGELHLRFPDGAYYLQPFVAELEATEGGGIEQVVLDLNMPGMDMGRNRFQLRPVDEAHWRGTVLLPICVTGRVDWQVTVQMDSAGRRYIARFPLLVSQPPLKSD